MDVPTRLFEQAGYLEQSLAALLTTVSCWSDQFPVTSHPKRLLFVPGERKGVMSPPWLTCVRENLLSVHVRMFFGMQNSSSNSYSRGSVCNLLAVEAAHNSLDTRMNRPLILMITRTLLESKIKQAHEKPSTIAV